jgi:hypothetical protein
MDEANAALRHWYWKETNKHVKMCWLSNRTCTIMLNTNIAGYSQLGKEEIRHHEKIRARSVYESLPLQKLQQGKIEKVVIRSRYLIMLTGSYKVLATYELKPQQLELL